MKKSGVTMITLTETSLHWKINVSTWFAVCNQFEALSLKHSLRLCF